MRIAIGGVTGTVGRQVADTARRRGHNVVAMSRSTGVDLSDDAVVVGPTFAEWLASADAEALPL